MVQNFEKCAVPAVMARRVDAQHGQMLYWADGYMTAWFLYHLRQDAKAGQVFWGETPEIAANPLWQDVAIRP